MTTSARSTATCRRRRSRSRSQAAGWCRRSCDRKELEREFWDYCHTDASQRSRRRAGLRHQPRADGHDRRSCCRTRRCPASTWRSAIPYGSQTGADWKSTTHIDVLTRDCDVWIDDEQVIAQGRYLLGQVLRCRGLGIAGPRNDTDTLIRLTVYSHIMCRQYGQSCPPCGPQSSRLWRMPRPARMPDSR